MKKIIFLITLTAFVFYSCKNDKNPADEILTEDELIDRELASGKKNNEAILGFSFGMTRSDVLNMLKELEQKGKLRKDDDRRYFYDMEIGDSGDQLPAYFDLSYSKPDDQLYCITTTVRTDRDHVLKTLYETISSMYEKKFGVPQINKPNDIITDSKPIPVWINANRKIEIEPIDDAVKIHYLNLRVSRVVPVNDDL